MREKGRETDSSIVGITGQEERRLAEVLASKGYEVHPTIRRASAFKAHRSAWGVAKQPLGDSEQSNVGVWRSALGHRSGAR